MIPESFDYQRAGSVREALTLLKQHGENAKILAGGHSLIPTMKLRLANPAPLIDIGDISELKYINDKGDYLAIGAGTTHLMVETSSLVQQKAPALSQAAGQIGDVQVRNRGTIGGVLAHSDPQADYPGVVLALNTTIVAEGFGGERKIEAVDYFTGLWETALGENEILTEVRVPVDSANANSCYLKFPQPASRYPYVGCAVAMDNSGGNCSEVRVGFSGVAESAFRDSGVEDAIRGQALKDETIAAASAKAAEGRTVLSDYFVSEEYRRAMAQVYTKRALAHLS